jgi:hypothetical protein
MPRPISLNKICVVCDAEVFLPIAYTYIPPSLNSGNAPGVDRNKKVNTLKSYFNAKGAWTKPIRSALNTILRNMYESEQGSPPSLLLHLLAEQIAVTKKDLYGIFLEHNVQLRLLNNQWQTVSAKTSTPDLERGAHRYNIDNPAYDPDQDIHTHDILLFPCGTVCHQSCARKQRKRYVLPCKILRTQLHWIAEHGLEKIYCQCGFCHDNFFEVMRFALLISANPKAKVRPGEIKQSAPVTYIHITEQSPALAPEPRTFATKILNKWGAFFPMKVCAFAEESLNSMSIKELLEHFHYTNPKSYIKTLNVKQYELRTAFPGEHLELLRYTARDYQYLQNLISAQETQAAKERIRNSVIIIFACGCIFPIMQLWDFSRECVGFKNDLMLFTCPAHAESNCPKHTDAVVIANMLHLAKATTCIVGEILEASKIAKQAAEEHLHANYARLGTDTNAGAMASRPPSPVAGAGAEYAALTQIPPSPKMEYAALDTTIYGTTLAQQVASSHYARFNPNTRTGAEERNAQMGATPYFTPATVPAQYEEPTARQEDPTYAAPPSVGDYMVVADEEDT